MQNFCSLEEVSSLSSAIIAALAVIVSAIITIKVTKSQINSARELLKEEVSNQAESALLQVRANVISSNRQDWINSLRNEVSAFVADSVIASSMLSQKVGDSVGALELMKAILLRIQKVRLLLNPSESEHNELVLAMQDVFTNLRNDKYDITSSNNKIIEISQGVLKKEWERVKSFT